MIGIGIGLDLARGGVAVHDRQSDVHQNEIGPMLCDRRLRRFRQISCAEIDPHQGI